MNRVFMIVVGFMVAGPSYAKFEGDLVLIPDGCQQTRTCKIKNKLRYTDPASVVWEAKKGLETDGASIPFWAQPFIGKPYDSSYIKAAVIHDHYCDRHVRPWRQTHRVFYDALVELGIPSLKSKLMYYAVYLGGPKWIKLIPGNNCGKNCLNRISTMTSNTGYSVRKDLYDQPGFIDDLKEVEKMLNLDPEGISLEDLEKRAISKRPNDFYYLNEESVHIEDSKRLMKMFGPS